jgi:hypothetical protein
MHSTNSRENKQPLEPLVTAGVRHRPTSKNYISMEQVLVAVNQLENTIRGVVPPQYLAQYDDLMKQGHPMSKDLPLMNPFHCVLIVVLYLLSVAIGRRFMKSFNHGFKLTWLMVYHNFFLICLSLWMGVTILTEALRLKLPFRGGSVLEIDAQAKTVIT